MWCGGNLSQDEARFFFQYSSIDGVRIAPNVPDPNVGLIVTIHAITNSSGAARRYRERILNQPRSVDLRGETHRDVGGD